MPERTEHRSIYLCLPDVMRRPDACLRVFPRMLGLLALLLGLGLSGGMLQAEAADRAIGVAPGGLPGSTPMTGDYWAVLIGIDEYAHASDLESAVKDVRALRTVLEARYGFHPDRIKQLLNAQATRENIIDTLYALGREAKPEDSVFIYYAGHGQYDKAREHGWWVPTEGKPWRAGTLLENTTILRYIKGMQARHVFLVVDSCFSGSLFGTRAVPPITDRWYAELHKERSRWGLTSGGTEPVADRGLSGHSPFAYFLLKMLRENEQSYLVPSTILEKLARLVANNTTQVPRSGPLRQSGDEGGQFVFRLAGEHLPDSVETGQGDPVPLIAGEHLPDNVETGQGDPVPLTAGEHLPDSVETGQGDPVPLTAGEMAMERAFWNTIKDSQAPEEFEAYLKQYPDGTFVELARRRLDERLGLTPEAQRLIHFALKAWGFEFESGGGSGRFDARRRAAIGRWQAAQGRPVTGYLDRDSATTLQETGRQQRTEVVLANLRQQMVHVQGGAFTMGCTEEQEKSCSYDEHPAHLVQVRSFEISKYEVTRELWKVVMGNNPSSYKNYCPRCPVGFVSWENISAFLQKLNELSGERYRLPTEAEWEYAARGGTKTIGYRYAGSHFPVQVAWYSKNSGDAPHPVGQKAPNELGLYDMSGNVFEWVQDCWHDYYASAPRDGSAWTSGNCGKRVFRGGSWRNKPKDIRTAQRNRLDTWDRNDNIGFRVARTLTDSEAAPRAADRQQEDEVLQSVVKSMRKWEFKSSIEIDNPDLQSSGCADATATDSSGRNLTDIAEQWGYDPEEAHAFGLKIQDAVRERDLTAFFSLVDGELDYGPRRKYVENKAFRDIFPDSWRTAILNDEPPCTPVGWRGFMLANGLLWYEVPSKSRDTFRIVSVHDWVPEKFPPVPVGWKVDGRLLPPQCFVYVWDSDNFQEVARLFSMPDWDGPVFKDFAHNTGKYFGRSIYPFDPDLKYSLWRYVGDCARDLDPDQLQISDSTVEYVYPESEGREFLRYTILADVSPDRCHDLAPGLPKKCIESYLVDINYCGGSLGCRGLYTIYGMFQMRNGKRIIFPLKNFRTENPARNFLDNK